MGVVWVGGIGRGWYESMRRGGMKSQEGLSWGGGGKDLKRGGVDRGGGKEGWWYGRCGMGGVVWEYGEGVV